METTIGGDRLGSGNKQQTSFKNYERSTHDLSYVWRSSMACGTLVPFMKRVALPGDKWEIDLNTEVLTLPTIGPLFGSYKVQLDVFEVPVRLYNAKLHMNKLGVGMDMRNVKLPYVQVKAKNKFAAGFTPTWSDNSQVNASSLFKYLGISGLGSYSGVTPDPVVRYFNAVPLLAYWDIYKNYYSNKQEEVGVVVHTSTAKVTAGFTPIEAYLFKDDGMFKGQCKAPVTKTLELGDKVEIYYEQNASEPVINNIPVIIDAVEVTLIEAFSSVEWNNNNKTVTAYNAIQTGVFSVKNAPSPTGVAPNAFFSLETFPLENIDTMRLNLLRHAADTAYGITESSPSPYGKSMELVQASQDEYAIFYSQEGLGIKTYQSDLFNNWISTEWIEGDNGVNALTAVDTTDGNFTIDALNIASKVYDMLNRIAISGGTYDDWLEAVYTHERVRGTESPVYCGSLIKELSFEEIISTAETEINGQRLALGTLAGRGRLTGKHKGGKITITANEPSYIIGIVSLTPRVDYSQGNDWDTKLDSFADFHVPALDGIGFQDLVTEQLLWSDTVVAPDLGLTFKSLGKQPAWINYMTEVNKTYGSFAEPYNSMFMTLNRRYAKNADGTLKDGTTYIDPTKFNNIFADQQLSAQNFWVQIACNITARRKMSAKIIPNL